MPEPPKGTPKQSTLVAGLKYTHIAFAVPGGVFAGWLLGSLLDRWWGTTYMQFVGMGLGIIAGFYDLFRTMLRMNKESDGE